VSTARTAPAPFLIRVELGDGTATEIPASSYGELSMRLGRMSAACVKSGVPTPPTVVWRRDRGEPRPMSLAELEEADLSDLRILRG
jgi:hypothetical protein